MSLLQERSFFHEGMREFQDELDGRRVADAIERHRKHYSLWDSERELIQGAQFFFIASAFREYVDCSIKSGDPGFVKIISENVIEYPEYDGNSMYRTLGNIKRNPNVGLLFVKEQPHSHQWKSVHSHGTGISGTAFWREGRLTN